jgi:hypothetical protein
MKPAWTTLGCIALAAIWVWAGALKALDPAAFATNIMGFTLVPWPVAAGLALYLPSLELITAAALLIPRWRSAALLVSLTLFVVFTILWAITWARGIDVACGCFGGEGRTTAGTGFVRALALSAATAWLWQNSLRSSLRVAPAPCKP